MLDAVVETTVAAGMSRYEVSAFARRGHACAHNLNYWQFGDYLGIGAGAHGKISFAHRIVRQVRWRDPQTYVEHALAGQPVSNEHEVARRDLPFEFALNALRLRQGFTVADFCARTGLPSSALERPLALARARGLIEWEDALDPAQRRVAATSRGFDFLSDLQALFLPD
jgi:oxygen-independent coproporphyrinogen-3 oxidase